MLLAVNANNTNIKFAIYDGEVERGAWRAATMAKRTADEYAVWMTQLMALDGLKPSDVTDAVIATVVPEALFELIQLVRRYFGFDPFVYGKAEDRAIAKVERPEEVGADRLINTIAAHALCHGPALVVDLGTATTFDVVDAEGHYRGGAIAPGINLSMDALSNAAAALPRIAIQRPELVIGTTTVKCMQSGVFWGYVGLIEGMVARIKAEFAAPMTVMATGGLAPIFADATSAFDRLVPDLTMRGLVIVHRRRHGAR